MNRTITYARNKLDSIRASEQMVISQNKDLSNDLDLDRVLCKWAASKNASYLFDYLENDISVYLKVTYNIYMF